MPDAQQQFIAVLGNLNDGYAFYGPFDSFDEASDFVDPQDKMSWIVELEEPHE